MTRADIESPRLKRATGSRDLVDTALGSGRAAVAERRVLHREQAACTGRRRRRGRRQTLGMA